MRFVVFKPCAFTGMVAAVFALPLGATAAEPAVPPFATAMQPLMEQYCLRCHGETRPKGGVNLARFKDEKLIYREPKLWQTVLDQLHDRTMPPEGKAQPTDTEREEMVAWVKSALDNFDGGALPKDPGRVLIHRLSRSEYNNTVRDLFGVEIKPADKFPADGGGGAGFDNIADTLFIPPILMERFLTAADEVLEAAKPERLYIVRPGGLRSKRAAGQKIIEHYAPKIFRRPLEKGEIDPLIALFDRSIKNGDSFEAATKLAFKAMLVSPKFLFRIESDQSVDAPYRINNYELASRLSYFIWSSMPDDQLFQLAAQKRLSDTNVLKAQVTRMLRDPKADAFSESFAGQWLHIRELTTTAQPDSRRFPDFTPELRDSMMEEPIAIFRGLLRENGSLEDLIDSDYTYVNERLAKHYGIEGISGPEFRRVKLADRNRGGVLGTAAVLTLTSYPARTSPVLRGKWVLEELLGTPPPPPPPLVATLPRDDSPREGLTFRQQLERHRKDPNCASCHKRMDPLGLGLENFDAIGRWRNEIKGVPVDASGVLVTGEKFSGPAELKKLLLERRQLFIRNVTEKMLSYALGRGLEFYDIPEVKRIARAVESSGSGAATLVTEVAMSYPFQYRRNVAADSPASANASNE